MTPSAAVSVPASTPFVDVTSDLFGTISVPEDAILTFPAGIYGFEGCTTYIVVEAQLPGFFWLQSTERSSLLFLLADPFMHAPGYDVTLDAATREALHAEREEDVGLLAIVTLPLTEEQEATLNLQGPIALNMATRMARQLVLEDTRWGCRHPVDLEVLGGEPV